METVEILWTGGLDSTFRVVQLSRQNICIQPYYVTAPRNSMANEILAVEYMMHLLQKHPNTKAKINPLVLLNIYDYSAEKYKEAHKRLTSDAEMGNQYIWLAEISEQHKGLEMAIHKDDIAVSMIEKKGKFRKAYNDEIGYYYELDTENSNDDLSLLFGNFHFPLIDYTKLDMKKYYLENGYEKIMLSTWFCHNPIKGQPCGMCNPCVYAYTEGMPERLGRRGRLRYIMKTKCHVPQRFIQKLI